jgi:hypothetical protein
MDSNSLPYTEPNSSDNRVRAAEEYAQNNLSEVLDFIQNYTSEVSSFNREYLVKKSDYSRETIHSFLSVCSNTDHLAAFIKIRCPSCATDHGSYYSKSDIPDETVPCFVCKTEFQKQEQHVWNVRYTFQNPTE